MRKTLLLLITMLFIACGEEGYQDPCKNENPCTELNKTVCKDENMDEIAETHKIECWGVERKNLDSRKISARLLRNGDEESVIVKVFRSGRTIPLCRYLQDGKCNAPYWKAGGTDEDHRRQEGDCIYVS